jgi:hypothetical protein
MGRKDGTASLYSHRNSTAQVGDATRPRLMETLTIAFAIVLIGVIFINHIFKA